MAGKHRAARRAARPTARSRHVEMVDARTGQAHLLTDEAVAAGRGAMGRYVALCCVEVCPASLTAPPQGHCTSCISIPSQRARTAR